LAFRDTSTGVVCCASAEVYIQRLRLHFFL
jgi:hypothetical protein